MMKRGWRFIINGKSICNSFFLQKLQVICEMHAAERGKLDFFDSNLLQVALEDSKTNYVSRAKQNIVFSWVSDEKHRWCNLGCGIWPPILLQNDEK